MKKIIIYFQSECIQKYQFELCSKSDREYGFDVIYTWISRTLSQANVASIQMMSRDKLKHQVRGQFCRAT